MADPDIAVSVIVSTRNRAHFLSDCLASLAAQRSTVPYEVVVIDNGSTDGTQEILDRWSRSDARFRTGREDRVGLSRGMNAGIGMARGSLLLFTDDDVVADPAWVKAYVELFSRLGDVAALAGGPIVPIAEDLGHWPAWFHPDGLVDMGLWSYPEERQLGAAEYVFGGNMAIPAELFRRWGLWDEALGNRGDHRGTFEDTEFQDRVRPSGVEIWFCPSAIVKHRVSSRNASARAVISRAFQGGRNDFWREGLRRYGDETSVPPRSFFGGGLSLAGDLAREAVRTAAFRASPSPGSFDRARRAARRTGWTMETLRPHRGSTRLFRGVAKATLLTRALLTRLIPSAPEPTGTSDQRRRREL
jgi:GT2 family glycosyltransferase